MKIEKEHELRVEGPATVVLTRGSAEVFGELLITNELKVLGMGWWVISTLYGAEVDVVGDGEVTVARDSYLLRAIDLHARFQHTKRVLVCGPMDTGKSTLVRVLCAYAARAGKPRMCVDLDPGQGVLPGVLAAGDRTYFYGHVSPGVSVEGFKATVTSLARDLVTAKGLEPCIINTCGWVDGMGYTLLLWCARTLLVDVVLVLGDPTLASRLKRDLRSDIVVVPATGAVPRTPESRKLAREAAWRNYFEGATPVTLPLSLLDVQKPMVAGHVMAAEVGFVYVQKVDGKTVTFLCPGGTVPKKVVAGSVRF